MASFDGENWASIGLPEGVVAPPTRAGLPRQRVGLSAAPNGSLWLAAGGLWRREAEAWQRVALPKPEGVDMAVDDVHAESDGSVWVLASWKDKRLVLHTQPTPRRVPPYMELMDTRAACMYPTLTMEDRKRASNDCLEPFVLLHESTRASLDMASIEKVVMSLKGHPELAVRKRRRVPCFVGSTVRDDAMRLVRIIEKGKAYFGARVPDLAIGKRVAALVKTAVPDASPELLCHRPDADAELSVDLASGAIKGWLPAPDLTVQARAGLPSAT